MYHISNLNTDYTILIYPCEWSLSEGKRPELELARSSAIWENATLEQLQDKQLLINRLPDLIKEFKQTMENIGFIY